MAIFKPILFLSVFAQKVNLGTPEDVDFFMSHFNKKTSLQIIKLADFALSQVRSKEGVNQIKHYLYSGSEMQQSYAALYFKRHQKDHVLKETYNVKPIN